jgi:DNA-binding NarL/FixJ family response regulator
MKSSSLLKKNVIRLAIVDDKLIVRRAIRGKLQGSEDIKIILEANNGKEFIEKMHGVEELPAIVLMDIEMPVMDGLQTIAVASMLFPTVKFIVLSVFDHPEKIFEAIKAGAHGYLLKDDDAIDLREAIRHVVEYESVPMSPAIARKTLGLLKTGGAESKTVSASMLSAREQEVLQKMIEGLDYNQIAGKLFISPATVRTHISKIYQKLHVRSKIQAINLAYKNNWV